MTKNDLLYSTHQQNISTHNAFYQIGIQGIATSQKKKKNHAASGGGK